VKSALKASPRLPSNPEGEPQSEQIARDYARMQSRLAKIVELAPVSIHEFRIAADGSMTMPFSTAAIEDIYGIPPDQLAKDFSVGFDLVHPDDRRSLSVRMEESRRTLAPFHDEWRIIHPVKGEIWVECHSTPERQTDGATIWYGYLRDVTERKRAEERLRNSEERYRALHRDNPVMIFTLDPAGNVLSINPAAVEQLGYREEELTGSSVLRVFHPDDRDAVERQLKKCLAEPHRVHHWQFRKIRKDGQMLWVEELAQPVKDLAGGVNVLVVCQDVSERRRHLELLERRERQFRTLAENSPDVIIRYDRQGRRLYVNPAYAQEIGERPEQALNKTIDEHWLLDTPISEYKARLMEVLEKGIHTRVSLLSHRPDGSHVIQEVRLVPERNGAGEVVGALAIGRNITAIKEAEIRLRTLVENLPDFVARFDRQARVLYVNPAVMRTVGQPLEHFVGRTLPELGTTGDSEEDLRLHNAVLRAFDEGQANALESCWIQPDGVRWYEIRHVPEKDDQGNVTSVLGIVRDVSKRKQAEEEIRRLNTSLEQRVRERTAELAAERTKLKSMLESISDGFNSFDRNFHYTYVNSAAAKIMHTTPEQLLGACLWDQWPLADHAIFGREFRRSLAEGIPIQFEGYYPDPLDVWFDVRCYPSDEGLSVFFSDITEHKRAELEILRLNKDLKARAAALEAANKELEAFSYSVSHDLRAPLRSIDGFSRILLEDYHDKLDEEGRESLRTVRAASQRMGRLIDDMLQLSRITRSEMRLEPVDLSAMAEGIAAMLKDEEPDRKAEFAIEPGLVACGDGRLLRIALENLLGNAWKFTSHRPLARIEVGRAGDPAAPSYFVRDDGVGFDMAYVHKLFGAFQRLHTTAEFPGTGIGLATVQRIVHRHGGQVWAEGETGSGATFYFTLPGKEACHNA
jgi:PAS domain S-box-containing protein